MITFRDFLAGPGGRLCQRLGIPLGGCRSWNDFTMAAVRQNVGCALANEAYRLHGVLSPGERCVLYAILHAADFDALADELSGGATWHRLSRVGGAHRDAVLACIARREDA